MSDTNRIYIEGAVVRAFEPRRSKNGSERAIATVLTEETLPGGKVIKAYHPVVGWDAMAREIGTWASGKRVRLVGRMRYRGERIDDKYVNDAEIILIEVKDTDDDVDFSSEIPF